LNFRSLPFLPLLLLALATVLSSQPATPALTLLSKDGRRPLPLTITGDQELVGLDDLASTFQLQVQESLGAITVSYKGRTIVLTPDQSLASVSGRLISLPAAPTRAGRRWLVPVEFISRALAPIYDTRLDLRKPSRLLVVGDLRVPRITTRYEALGAAARLTFDATPRADSTISQDNQRLLIKFDADALDLSGPLPTPGPQGLIQAVRQIDATTLAADIGPRFGGFKATSQPTDNSTRQQIDLLTPTDTTQAPSTPSTPQTPSPAVLASPPEVPPALGGAAVSMHTIVLDPGHGGDDDGARSASGTKEKDIALSVARRGKAAIEGRLGIRVLLTRDEDKTVAIDDRTAIANNNKADLFISVHVNASMRRSTSGATIFYARFDPDAAALAPTRAGERLPTFGGGLRDIELVPWDLAQTRHLDHSTMFATLLQEQLAQKIPLTAKPVDSAALRLLESANMPAVLVELGYVTNADQEKQLTSDAFQASVVQALYDAVVRFRDSLAGGGTR
jgi:N-acetylmuramoyl-L-alanine amidase